MIHYGMTKTAMLAVSRGLAEAVAGTGITVNSVLPGPTRSRGVGEFIDSLAKSEGKSSEKFEEEFFEKVRPTSLIKRFATPEEVASMVVYIASPLASATTGAALRVDGGVVKSAFWCINPSPGGQESAVVSDQQPMIVSVPDTLGRYYCLFSQALINLAYHPELFEPVRSALSSPGVSKQRPRFQSL
jgi:hypothetical protein